MLSTVDCFGMTDIGKKRSSNQDHFLIAELNKSMQVQRTSLDLRRQSRLEGGTQGTLLMVADGMGGHAGGERASALAIDGVTTYILNCLPWCFRLEQESDADFLDELKSAVRFSHREIEATGQHDPSCYRMATTLTMAYLVGSRMFVVHAGDSRCYVYRDGALKQITTDHTVAKLMEQAPAPGSTHDHQRGGEGGLAASESRWSHVLWNYLGGHSSDGPSVEVHNALLKPKDKILLCTDGLFRHLTDRDILPLLGTHDSAKATCQNLVQAANASGGSDNVTVVLACVGVTPARRDVTVVEEGATTHTSASAQKGTDTTAKLSPLCVL